MIPEDLYQKFIAGKCSPEEVEQLLVHFGNPDNEAVLRGMILNQLNREPDNPMDLREKEEAIYANIQLQMTRRKIKWLWPRIAAAASILLALSFGGYELFHKQPKQQIAQNQIHDIAPGGNKAILILSNGQKVSVTDAQNGIIAKQQGLQVKKTKSGDLVYIVNKNAASGPGNGGTMEVAYNTVETPRGGQTHVTLADGTVAYLDAASSIRFPLAFNAKERRVEITGQVYFEVVHNAKQPFSVSVRGETIEDIGTHFNVNAYDDESAIRTTLLEGSVSVADLQRKTILKPGQQAIGNGQTLKTAEVNTAYITAWKDGYFRFQDENLQTIMRRLARWYDIEVSYQGEPVPDLFSGRISRNKNISEVLNMMGKTKRVQFKIEGRRVTVIQ